MSFYDNIECPVCHKAFKDGDDVVTCPKCGTPHHRQCYTELGHCANAAKHGTDFSFQRPHKVESATEPKVQPHIETPNPFFTANAGEGAQHTVQNSKSKCANCGEEIDKGVPFCSHCGARQPESNYASFSPPLQNVAFPEEKVYEDNDTTIDGEKLSDVAAVVRTNTRAFIPKFIKNKKISWNWCAFIFGPFYLFFRKMYKEGLIFLAVQFISNIVISGIYAKPLAAFYSSYTSYVSNMSSNTANAQAYADLQKMMQPVMPAFTVLCCIMIGIAIIIGLTANTMYRSKVLSVVKNVDSRIEQGSILEQSITMSSGATLSKTDIRKLYLAKLGGTNIYAPILAGLLMMFLQSFM